MKVSDLIKICDEKINKCKNELEQDKNNSNIIKELTILEKIKIVLTEQGERIFFKMDMESAFKILNKIIEKDRIKEVYAELTSPERYILKDDTDSLKTHHENERL